MALLLIVPRMKYCVLNIVMVSPVSRCLPVLLMNTLNESFHLLWRVEQVSSAFVKDPHLCWKYKSKVQM